jgi:hypothetical protein
MGASVSKLNECECCTKSAFAREGAKLFLTGRLRASVEAVAKDIVSAGGSAEAAEVKILGVPLIELDVEQFSLPIATYTRSYFLTARLVARRMVANKSG